MWYVNKLFDQAQVESLAAKGFLVRSSGGVVRIEKHSCGAELRKNPAGRFQMTIVPSIMHQGQFTRLWDAGYQKFADERRAEAADPRGAARPICARSTKSSGPRSACPRITTKPSVPPASTASTTA